MRRSKQTYHTEPMLRELHAALVKDLKPMKPTWFTDPRNYKGPRYDYWDPYKFKVMYQLENMCKRVLFKTDRTFDELADESFRGFEASQETFGIPDSNRIQTQVFGRARDICHDILGEFDFVEFSKLCQFGKRAAAKLPARVAYLDKRTFALNGSTSQIEWFKAVLNEDLHLHRACRLGLKQAEIIDTLELKAVPKSHKSARIIAPDTTIGGFLSTGLGKMIRRRLEAGTHINLSEQQDRHKDLAMRGSIDGYAATIDMSKASDSFVWEHVEALVPESWWSILQAVRTPTVTVGEREVVLTSYMLMGSGHTFPLQTVLFYSLTKAVLELMGSNAKVDVYGDDIIFPREYSHYVIASLHHTGFTVNVDKSFVDGPFRESCGGDYHTGVDVRPFMPEHVCAAFNAHEYTECLHKWYNGLLVRWNYEEIPSACDLLLHEIIRIWGNLCPIPETDPDTFGVKYIPNAFRMFVERPSYKDGRVTYLRLVGRQSRRKPKTERPYYWNWLRNSQAINRTTWRNRRMAWLIALLEKEADELVDSSYEGKEPVLDHKGLEPVKGKPTVRWVKST